LEVTGSHFARRAVCISIAAAMLAGCGGSQPPIGALGAMPQTRVTVGHADHRRSWMLPEASSEALLYISNTVSTTISVYSYPSHYLVGTLTGFTHPEGQCVDANGDVWITDRASLVEYAHGGSSPMRTLRIKQGAGALGCSVAPNGDLAVSAAVEDGPSHIRWVTLVYKGASGNPSIYANSKCTADFLGSPGYDDQGNLYVEGSHKRQTRGTEIQVGAVCELPFGGRKLRKVVFGKPGRRGINVSSYSSSVMWDGKYLVFGVILPYTRLYRTKELPSGDLELVSHTTLRDSTCRYSEEYALNFFLVGTSNALVNHREAKVVLSGNEDGECSGTTYLNAWRYPGGGVQKWSLGRGYSLGQSVSFPQ
jgi:hypothetical protein